MAMLRYTGISCVISRALVHAFLPFVLRLYHRTLERVSSQGAHPNIRVLLPDPISRNAGKCQLKREKPSEWLRCVELMDFTFDFLLSINVSITMDDSGNDMSSFVGFSLVCSADYSSSWKNSKFSL